MLVALTLGVTVRPGTAQIAGRNVVDAPAHNTVRITGDRLSGSVLPVQPLTGAIEFSALRGRAWTVDDTKRLLLEGDVVVRIADRQFTAGAAVIWMNRLPSASGLINQIAVYFDRVTNPQRPSGVGVGGKSLLVTASTRGEIRLETARLDRDRPLGHELVREGEQRLQEHLRTLVADPPRLAGEPQVDRPPAPYAFTPTPGARIEERDYELPETIDLPDAGPRRPWLREPDSTLRFSYGEIHVAPGATENIVTVTGSIIIEYFSDQRTDELAPLILSADRAVVFTDPGSLEEMAGRELDASTVRGIYLEGNVIATANDGEYLARAPRIYYDLQRDEAILLDAVLRTYERDGRLPIYTRAEEIRQIAATQWEAKNVRVTTSEFFTGHLALGASRMTITRRPIAQPDRDVVDPDAPRETHLDARNITLRAGNTPFFWWPRFAGTVDRIPLRGVSMGVNDNDGVEIETRWDLLSLMGGEFPAGLDAELTLGGFTKRGPAGGLDVRYEDGAGAARLELYGVYDNGVDRTSSGREIQQDDAYRGVALWEHRLSLAPHWTLQSQASYISDETFINSWRERDFVQRRAYETSGYLKYQRDQTAFTLLGQYALNDYISNDWLLASQAYQVDRAPEATYRTNGNAIFGDRATYSGETRLGRMRLVLEDSTPRQLGIPNAGFGPGVTDDTIIANALRGRGLETKWVTRFDTRHEITWPFQVGVVEVTPFVVGRFTAYDSGFEAFSPQSEKTRAFASAGVRLVAHFQHVDNTVESRLFDLHRLRHLVEPSVTIWHASSDVSEDDLPVYDLGVESLATGSAIRVGLRNTWQTQRGGPGRWRSVDVFTLDTDLVLTSNDVNRESPSAQFFDYRPEYSQMGDHVATSGILRLSDTFIVSGQSTIDIDESAIARGAVGVEMRHDPLLSTHVEYRYLDASDLQLLGIGWNYRLSAKYRVSFQPQWDFVADEIRYVTLNVERRFPDFAINVFATRDEIRDDTSVGASLRLLEY